MLEQSNPEKCSFWFLHHRNSLHTPSRTIIDSSQKCKWRKEKKNKTLTPFENTTYSFSTNTKLKRSITNVLHTTTVYYNYYYCNRKKKKDRIMETLIFTKVTIRKKKTFHVMYLRARIIACSKLQLALFQPTWKRAPSTKSARTSRPRCTVSRFVGILFFLLFRKFEENVKKIVARWRMKK